MVTVSNAGLPAVISGGDKPGASTVCAAVDTLSIKTQPVTRDHLNERTMEPEYISGPRALSRVRIGSSKI